MIIDGRAIAKQIKERIREEKVGTPTVVAVILGENPASESYLRMLEKTCESTGFGYRRVDLDSETTEETLIKEIQALNASASVDGILIQMPLPKHIDEKKVLMAVDPMKDVDGFNPINAGRLFKGEKAIPPCTPLAVMTILEASGIDVAGKHVVIIGRSNIVGKPLAIMMLQKNATVTICHSKTVDLKRHTLSADIVVAAVGVPEFLKADMICEGAVVIDVGTNEVDGKLVGDVDFAAVSEKASAITPVPGGVGPVTNAVLLRNVLTRQREG
ncbi:MAG: methylenetetrahydrofolate dehydrogenase / methenyltetrahydrofolate cyclohydrolase [Clostridiales bacterium]|jgi:methylenetetrahydrofolate dehydrogenase (NADP+)/methenyltetrahydrofolate cyclohydrolase|nr:methylenetetrahydrofolate dehydrogenase / methenyltetrahydrofolate cyclohydrolase [Clostridiales bacterium]